LLVVGIDLTACGSLAQFLYDKFEKECVSKGWKQVSVLVGGRQRKILWKGPEPLWKNGAVIALHGGGGTYSNFCANIELGKPMVNFGELAISEGFAVFSLDSEEGLLKDEKGVSCGKRWLSVADDKGSNPDLEFIEKVLREVIPALRPANSSGSIFMTGISNGGFMTVLAATHFGDSIDAFAPVSAGDPYGTYVDCTKGSPLRGTPGWFMDAETRMPVNEEHACGAKSYPREQKWVKSSKNTPFKLFYHSGDGVLDISCKEKLQRLLVDHGYMDAGSFVLKGGGRRILNHFWKEEYNKPLIEFFLKYSKKAGK
jgi:hypothetical protein